MSAEVGSDILSKCRKCGEVWHVVVAKDGDAIAKVECKECKGNHKYKAVGEDAKKAAPKKKKTTTRTRKKAAEVLPDVEPDLSIPTRPYSARETFSARERVDHPSFGTGVVERSGDGKISVRFPEGRKTLMQARGESQLSRPQPFVHEKKTQL